MNVKEERKKKWLEVLDSVNEIEPKEWKRGITEEGRFYLYIKKK